MVLLQASCQNQCLSTYFCCFISHIFYFPYKVIICFCFVECRISNFIFKLGGFINCRNERKKLCRDISKLIDFITNAISYVKVLFSVTLQWTHHVDTSHWEHYSVPMLITFILMTLLTAYPNPRKLAVSQHSQ